jgi:hypothetical protein
MVFYDEAWPVPGFGLNRAAALQMELRREKRRRIS